MIIFYLLYLLTDKAFALTEKEFIQKVITQKNHFIEDQIYLEIKQIELNASKKNYANFKTNFTIGMTNNYYDTEKDTTSTSISDKRRTANNAYIGLTIEKKFLNNPANLNIRVKKSTPNTDFIRYKQNKFYDEYEINTNDKNYKISYKYPLLKHNSTNAKSLKTYHRNILDLKREELDFLENQESFLVDSLELYLTWAKYQEIVKIYQKYLNELNAIPTLMPKEKPKLKDVISAVNNNISKHKNKLQLAKIELSIFLNDESLLDETIDFDYDKKVLIIKNLTQYLHANNYNLLKAVIDKKLKKTDINYYKNQQLPALDFSISAEKNTNIGNTLTTQYNNKSINYISSLVFSMPIGVNISNEKDLMVAKLNLSKLDLAYKNEFKDIFISIKEIEADIILDEKLLSEHKKLRKATISKLKNTHKEYNNKTIKFKDLLKIYQQKIIVELDYINLIINYQENILKYNNSLNRILKI